MNIIGWICTVVVVTVGVMALIALGAIGVGFTIGKWWPSRLRTRQDRANAAEIARIDAAMSRVGGVGGCLSYNVEELCWFCQQYGIQARDIEMRQGTVRKFTREDAQ